MIWSRSWIELCAGTNTETACLSGSGSVGFEQGSSCPPTSSPELPASEDEKKMSHFLPYVADGLKPHGLGLEGKG